MKANYEIVQALNYFLIREKKTDQYLISYDLGIPAMTLCEKLNRGSGFEGETPAFFAKKIVQVNLRKSVDAHK